MSLQASPTSEGQKSLGQEASRGRGLSELCETSTLPSVTVGKEQGIVPSTFPGRLLTEIIHLVPNNRQRAVEDPGPVTLISVES